MTLGIQKLNTTTQTYLNKVFPTNFADTTTGVQLYHPHTIRNDFIGSYYVNAYGLGTASNNGGVFNTNPDTGAITLKPRIPLPWMISFYVRADTNRSGYMFALRTETDFAYTQQMSSFTLAAGADGVSIGIDTPEHNIACDATFNLNEYSNGYHHVYILFDPRTANSTANKLFVDGRRQDYTSITAQTPNGSLTDDLNNIYFGGVSFTQSLATNYPSYSLSGSNRVDLAQFGIYASPTFNGSDPTPIGINKFYPNINLGSTGKVQGVDFGGPAGGSGDIGGYPALYCENPGLSEMRGWMFSGGNSILSYSSWLSTQSLNADSSVKTLDQYGDEILLGIDADTLVRDASVFTAGSDETYDIKGLGSIPADFEQIGPPTALLKKPSTFITEVPGGIYTSGHPNSKYGHVGPQSTTQRNSTFTYESGIGEQTITAGKIISFWATYEVNAQFKMNFPKQGLVYCPSPDDNYYAYKEYFEINLNYSATTASSNFNLVGKTYEPVVCPQGGSYNPAELTNISLTWSSIKTYLSTTNKWNHFLLLCNSTDNQNVSFTLYINGQSLGAQIGGSNGYVPVIYDAIKIDQGNSGSGTVKRGSIQQFWYGSKPNTFNINDFWNNGDGYKDLGVSGTAGATQTLPSPILHEVFTYPFTTTFMPSPATFSVLNKENGLVLTTYKGQDDNA